MSRETTEARAAARAAEANWRSHHHGCPRCTRAVRACRWDDLCKSGEQYRGVFLDAQAELKWNREQDKLPAPDQEALF